MAFGALSALAALGLYLLLLARLRGDEARHGETAWFGYARDAANLVGGGALLAAFVLAGFGAPEALLLGAASALLAYCIDWVAAKRLRLPGAMAVTLVTAGF